MTSEYLPSTKTIWLLFDLSNGHMVSRRYLWWFETRREAMDHRREQHKLRNHARLSLPVRANLRASR